MSQTTNSLSPQGLGGLPSVRLGVGVPLTATVDFMLKFVRVYSTLADTKKCVGLLKLRLSVHQCSPVLRRGVYCAIVFSDTSFTCMINVPFNWYEFILKSPHYYSGMSSFLNLHTIIVMYGIGIVVAVDLAKEEYVVV